MSIRMKEFTIHFDPESGGLRHETQTVNFTETVKRANAVMKGFEAKLYLSFEATSL